jgi:pimeloyl-ACP methyl ester carboxylesterase
MSPSIENRGIALSDGRSLTWAEYGQADGTPILFFHGGNDSRLAGRLLADAAERAAVRLICPDRPGFGGSAFQPGRRLVDWPGDITDLADHLGLGEFPILGHSGGGPHALACAHAMGSRIRAVATVSSAAPPPASNRGMHPMFRIVNVLMKSSALYRPMARSQLSQMRGSPDRWLQVWGRMQPADGALFGRRPEVAGEIVAEMSEGARQGIDGIVHEAGLYHRDWGFPLDAVAAPVHVWHGRQDRQAAVAWAQHLAGTIPGATLSIVDDGGHFSTLIDHADEILEWLTTAKVAEREGHAGVVDVR